MGVIFLAIHHSSAIVDRIDDRLRNPCARNGRGGTGNWRDGMACVQGLHARRRQGRAPRLYDLVVNSWTTFGNALRLLGYILVSCLV